MVRFGTTVALVAAAAAIFFTFTGITTPESSPSWGGRGLLDSPLEYFLLVGLSVAAAAFAAGIALIIDGLIWRVAGHERS